MVASIAKEFTLEYLSIFKPLATLFFNFSLGIITVAECKPATLKVFEVDTHVTLTFLHTSDTLAKGI